MSFSQGSFIYSAKPRPTEAQMFELMDITEDMVIRAREYEDLIQMFGRCSIRNPDDEREVIFRVFSLGSGDHHRGTLRRKPARVRASAR